MGRPEGGSVGVPKDDRWCVHALGSGDKRFHHFSICGGQGPSAAEARAAGRGWEQREVSRLTGSGGARAGTLTRTRMIPEECAVHTCVELFMLCYQQSIIHISIEIRM